MINNKIYHSIYVLAEKLLEADSANDKETFDTLYVQLKDLCIENEKGNKDHPEQWETLADFTEDLDEALVIYQKALDKAAAIQSLQSAKITASKLDDKAFKSEINKMLARLLAE